MLLSKVNERSWRRKQLNFVFKYKHNGVHNIKFKVSYVCVHIRDSLYLSSSYYKTPQFTVYVHCLIRVSNTVCGYIQSVINQLTYILNIYAVQQDTQSILMSKFIQHLCQLDMFRTSSVHHHERFYKLYSQTLVCGNTRTTRHVQQLLRDVRNMSS